MENEGDLPKVYIGEEPEKEKTITPGKSCYGFLFFKSCFKAELRNPTCVGFTRDVPNLNEWYIANLGGSKVAPGFRDFYAGCLGPSAYPHNFNHRTDTPRCKGLYMLYVLKKQYSSYYKDGNGPQSPTPSTGSTGEGFQSVS